VRRALPIVAAVAVALAVAAAVFFAPDQGPVAAAALPCSPALLVALRGNGDTLDGDGGMGADAWAVAQRLRERLSAGGLELLTAGYPYRTGPWWRIGGHVRSASAALAGSLSDRHRRCPSERLALIGQSEGAAVVHLTLPSIGPQLAVAILMADPLRIASSPYDAASSPHDGVLTTLLLGAWPGGTGPARDVVPSSLTPVVRSYCLAEDPVCDPSPGSLWRRARGDSVHTTYRLNPNGIADRAAGFAASRLLAA
jgi:Cutinase